MSLTILSYMHVLCWQADLVKKHFSRYNHPHILCMCPKALQSDDRPLCDIEISGKTQNYRLKSVCNFKVTRFYLILPCKQHNWTSGTYILWRLYALMQAPCLRAEPPYLEYRAKIQQAKEILCCMAAGCGSSKFQAV